MVGCHTFITHVESVSMAVGKGVLQILEGSALHRHGFSARVMACVRLQRRKGYLNIQIYSWNYRRKCGGPGPCCLLGAGGGRTALLFTGNKADINMSFKIIVIVIALTAA